MTPVRPVVSLVEDHAVFRETLCTVVAASDEWVLDGVATSGEEALTMLEDHHPDVLLVDLSLPAMSGLELVREVQDRWPEIRCLILSGHAQPAYASEALDVGARGYVLKGAPRHLREAIRTILEGGRYVSESLVRDEVDTRSVEG
jgi:DNA-binding NarL/FixJ family response regulator